jgi:formamidopyrimidine-DNA glycosylase
MPEGVEICRAAEIISHELKNYKLKKIIKIDENYKKLKGELGDCLPSKITVLSIGKMMIFKLEDNNYITISFGLEGNLSFKEKDYGKIKFVFKKNNETKYLYYNDMISYGNITLHNSKESYNKTIKKLGIDLLQSDIDDNDIVEMINKIKKTKYASKLVLELLMDQKKLGSGIGNYLSAEILYDAEISPWRKINSLDKKELKALAHSIRKTMKLFYLTNNSPYLKYLKPYFNKVDKTDFHSDIKEDDEDHEFQVYRQKEDSDGNVVKKDKIIPVNSAKKRTTYWVPSIQE